MHAILVSNVSIFLWYHVLTFSAEIVFDIIPNSHEALGTHVEQFEILKQIWRDALS